MQRRDTEALPAQVVCEQLRDIDFVVEDCEMQGRVDSGLEN